MNLLLRLWLHRISHLFILILLAVFWLITYSLTHWLLNNRYKASVARLAEASFQTYRLQLSQDGTTIVLTQKGVPLTAGMPDLPKAVFGLEQFDSYRGTLGVYAGIATEIKEYYERRKASLLFSRLPTVSHTYFRIPASTVGFTNAYLSIGLDASALAELQASHFQNFANLAASKLLSGICHSETNLGLVPIAAVPSKVVNNAIQATTPILSGLTTGATVLTPPELSLAINDYFSRWVPELADQIMARCTNTSLTISRSMTLGMLLNDINCAMWADLGKIAEAETGSFWILGKYRWWEMIFWIWLGVLTMSFSKLIPHLLGLHTERPWEPRETLVVFAKVFYAPALGLVIIFMLGFLGFGQNEFAEFGRASLATLGVAFLLGMFPNTSLRILTDLCTQLFRRDIREGDPKIVPTIAIVQSQRSQKNDEAIYTLTDLKTNVFNHIAAVTK